MTIYKLGNLITFLNVTNKPPYICYYEAFHEKIDM